MAVVYEADVVRVYDLVVQRLELVVHKGGEHGFIKHGLVLVHAHVQIGQGRTDRHLLI